MDRRNEEETEKQKNERLALKKNRQIDETDEPYIHL